MWEGIFKNNARKIALDYKSSTEYAGIFLPGEECKCVIEALNSHSITIDKPIYAVEKNSKYISNIVSNLHNIGLQKPIIHNDELVNLNLNHKIDLAYLDLMSSMDEKLFNWLKNTLIPNLAPSFRVSILFTLSWRPKIPFLEKKLEEYKNNGILFDKSFNNNCRNRYQIATYLCLIKELFSRAPHMLVHADNDPYYCYNDNINPVVLYTVQSVAKKEENIMEIKPICSKEKEPMKPKPSHNIDALLSIFKAATTNPDKMRGFKRALTLYCRNKETQTGTPAVRFKAAVKMRLRKMGFDPSSL